MELVQMVFRSCYNIVPEHLLPFYRFLGYYEAKCPYMVNGHISHKVENCYQNSLF